MTKHRVLLWILAAVIGISGATPALAAPAPKAKAPAVGQKAGAISALLPVATVTRGVGRTAAKSEVKKGEDLYWNDLLQTARGGRARITLNDQSILSIGSQAELRIVKHDARTQQTLLQMTYGRVRAEVSAITRDGGRFEVRTPTAVAGVIGTDFGTDSSVGGTTFICISGAVSVSNSDPGVPGSVQCNAGQTTTVNTGKAPTPPTPATPAQIQQLIMDTTPATINAMSPAAGLPGVTIDATVTGTKLNGVNAAQISGSGVTATLNPGGSDTSLALHLVVAANAQPGLRTITLNKASGAGSATFFTVLTPPGQAQNTSGDPKKPYHDALDQLRQTGDSSLDTILAAIQQVVDQAEQALIGQNQNLTPQVDLTQATNALTGNVAAVQNAVNQGKTAIDQAATGAGSGFDSAFTTAYNALLQRNAAGTPDDTFNQAINAAFQQSSTALQQAIQTQQSSINDLVQSSGNSIGQISQGWMNTISTAAQSQGGGPTPGVRGFEVTADLGATVNLDANSSRATSGASIIGYNWALCDASYRPAQFGVALNGNPQGCNALPGQQSNGAEFSIATCNLQPNDYIARLVVTDSNQKQSSMDVKVHVLAPTYPDPAGTEQALAQAYSSLQLSQYLGFFDDVNFPGYTALSENVRKTFPTLASMNINVIVSSATVDCNTATVRANWEQNYAFSGAPTFINQQSEQLQHTMLRTPGKGWKVIDQHGDNGTVAGGTTLPGPTTTDAALPDIQVIALSIPSGVNANNALNVASGPANFVATITNVGAADLTSVTPVHFAIRQGSTGSGSDSVSTDQNIPTPLAAGASVQMAVSMNVPNLTPGTVLSFVAIANPNNTVAEKDTTVNQSAVMTFLVGVPLPDLQLNPVQATGVAYVNNGVSVIPPGAVTFTVPVTNAGNLPLTAATTVHFSLRDANNVEIASSDQNIPVPLNPNASVNLSATMTLPAAGPGVPYSMIATANPGCTVQEISCQNDPNNVKSISLAVGEANFRILSSSILFNGKPAPFTGSSALQVGSSNTVSAVVENAGNLDETGPITVTFACSGATAGGQCNNPNVVTVQAPAHGSGVTATAILGTNNLQPGNYTGTATLSTALAQSNTADDSASISFDSFDFTLAAQNGSTSPITVFLGGSFNLSALLTQTGSTPFPMTIAQTSGTVGLTVSGPATLTSGAAQNYAINSAFTAAPGIANVSLSATNSGITKTVNQQFDLVAPFVQTAAPILSSGSGTTQPLVVSVVTPGTVVLGTLPSGVTTADPISVQVQSSAGQTVVWNLQASGSSATGALTVPISMTGAAFTGTYTVPANLTVNGQPNFTIPANGIAFTGHTGALTGSDALQLGENTTAQIQVQNNGNGTTIGNITVSFDCPNCGTPQNVVIAAPAAGQTVTASIPYPSVAFPAGTNIGTATLTTAIQQSNVNDDSATKNFEATDFTLSFTNGFASPLQVFLGGSFTLDAVLQQFGPTPFNMNVTGASSGPGQIAAATPSQLSPSTPTSPTPITISASSNFTTGTTTYTLTATNHGVTKTATQDFNVLAPFVVTAAPTLLSGGGTQPLSIQANTPGTAVLGTLPTGVSTGDPLSVTVFSPGQIVTWNLQASSNSAVGSLTAPLTMTGTNFSYALNAPFVVNGQANFTVTNATFTLGGHTAPYIGAQALQVASVNNAFQVQVDNTGNASPTGNVTVTVNCSPANGDCSAPLATTFPAPAAGQSFIATIFVGTALNMTPGSYSATATLSTAIPQSNLSDDSATTSFDVVDFTLSFPNGSPSAIPVFQQGTFPLSALLTQSGTTAFPMAFTQFAAGTGSVTLSPPASSLTPGSPSTINVNASSTATLGTGTVTVQVFNWGVSKLITQDFTVTAPFTQTAAPVLVQGGASGALTITANTDGTYVLNGGSLPTGITTGDPLSVQVFSPGQILTWNLSASPAASSGALTLPLAISGSSGFSGTFNGLVSYTVGAAPDYAVASTDIAFVGHNAPYTGAEALQIDETFSLNVTVHNVGSASPTGTITVNLSCTPPGSVSGSTNCQGNPPPVQVAAPTAGNFVVATFTGLQFQDPAGAAPGYTGNVSISAVDASNNPIAEISTANNATSDTFDITDFALSLPAAGSQPAGGFSPFQNILYPTGDGQMTVAVTQVGIATGAYSVALSAGGLANTSVTAPASLTTGGTTGTVAVTVVSSTPTGLGNVVITGTNHGVSRTLTIPVNIMQPQIGLSDPVLKLNDVADPLNLQVGGTPTTITLQLNQLAGTPFAGSATLTPAVLTGINATNVSPSSVGSGQTFDWTVAALTGAPTVSTAQNIVAAIPDTNPPDSVTFPLFVIGSTVPDLTVVSFSAPGAGGPFVSGQGVDFSVSINNLSGGASAGGESITGTLNGADMNCSHPALSSMASGQPTPTVVTVHCVIPDYHDLNFSNATEPISFRISSDAVGDLNYANNTFSSGTIPVTNWHAVVSGAGVSDGSPLTLTIFSGGPWSTVGTVGATLDSGSSSVAFKINNGVLSSGLTLVSGASTVTAPSTFAPTISTTNGILQNGIYLAQLTLTLTDTTSGLVATRQATIHVAVNNQNISTPSRTITFTSSANNTVNTAPVQINGALPENLTVTGNCTNCTSGGTYDLTVHDDPITSTDVNHVSDSQIASNVAFGAPQTLTVSAQQDASGNISTGLSSTYTVGATAAQLSSARGIAPDSGGVTQALYFQVGDFDLVAGGINGNSCGNVVPNGGALALSISFSGTGGFNAPGSYQWVDSSASPVGGTPISFGGAPTSGTLLFSGNSATPYSTLNFSLSNTQALDGLQTYYLAVTITNATSSATKYFPFYFDASTAQNYCGIVSGARGMARIRGSWSRSALAGGGSILSAARNLKQPTTTANGTPDVRINAQDVTYSPSMPKTGDTVAVRFRITNAGDGDAHNVPIALQVNGRMVATDTFDVAAGRSTLAELQWTNAEAPQRPVGFRSVRPGARRESDAGDFSDAAGPLSRPVSLMLMVDPQHTMQQKSTLQKSAAVGRLNLAPGAGATAVGLTAAASAANTQRLILEMNDGACIGVHLATGGTTSCGSADLEISVADLGRGTYTFGSLNGISDLGQSLGGTTVSAAQLSSARYSSQALGQAGHSYAVQLSGGRTAVVTVRSIRSPGQLDARTRQIFRQNARRVMRGLAGDTEAPSAPGDVSGAAPQATVYFELLVQGQ